MNIKIVFLNGVVVDVPRKVGIAVAKSWAAIGTNSDQLISVVIDEKLEFLANAKHIQAIVPNEPTI